MTTLNSLLGGVSTPVLLVVVCVCSVGMAGSLMWMFCEAAKRNDPVDDELDHRQELERVRLVVARRASRASMVALGCECDRHALLADLAWCDLSILDATLEGDEGLLCKLVLEKQKIERELAAVTVPRPHLPKVEIDFAGADDARRLAVAKRGLN